MLKNFKDKERFIEIVGVSRSTVYFWTLQMSKQLFNSQELNFLSSCYLRNQFKLIKTVCNSNEELFS